MTNTLAMVSLTSSFRFPLKTTLSVAANSNKISASQTVSYNSAAVGGEYALRNNKLILNGEGRYTAINHWSQGLKTNLKRMQMRMGINWQVATRHALVADVNFLHNSGAMAAIVGKSTYDDVLIRLRYDTYF